VQNHATAQRPMHAPPLRPFAVKLLFPGRPCHSRCLPMHYYIMYNINIMEYNKPPTTPMPCMHIARNLAATHHTQTTSSHPQKPPWS